MHTKNKKIKFDGVKICERCGDTISSKRKEHAYKSRDGLYNICYTCVENEN